MTFPNNPRFVFGFLTVRPTATGGVRGGYLLTTEHGRPLEFHYTSETQLRGPQRVLFGAKIDEFLEVDLVALPLIEKQSFAPSIVVVDRESLLELRTRIPASVVCLQPADDPHRKWSDLIHLDGDDDRREFQRAVEIAPPNFNWLEPFERLTAALGELQETRAAG